MTNANKPTTAFDPERDPSVVGSAALNIDVSDDRRAFTISFADLSFNIQTTELDGRLIGLVTPLADAGPESTITFSVSGFAIVGTGSSATLWLRAGDHSNKVVSFPVGYDGSYIEQMTYTPTTGQTEVHLTIAVLVERDSEAAQQSILSIDAINAEVAVTLRTVAPKPAADVTAAG